jgi:hypothetical protein
MLDIYLEKSGFDHLIIDLRGNGGGFTNAVDKLIISPLINEPLTISFHQFIRNSFRNYPHFENTVNYKLSFFAEENYFEMLPALDFIENNNLVEIHLDDCYSARRMRAFFNDIVKINKEPPSRN